MFANVYKPSVVAVEGPYHHVVWLNPVAVHTGRFQHARSHYVFHLLRCRCRSGTDEARTKEKGQYQGGL